jgi:hypothetical protein
MAVTQFDIGALRACMSARSEPRDVAAANRKKYQVEITGVSFSEDSATISMREQGKVRGVDIFLRIDHAGLQLLLGGLHASLLAEAKKQQDRAESAAEKASTFEMALNNLAEQAIEMKEAAGLSDDQLPPIFVGPTDGWELAYQALDSAKA